MASDPSDDIYDFVDAPAAKPAAKPVAKPAAKPSPKSAVRSVPPAAQPLSYRPAPTTKPTVSSTEAIANLYMPLWLLVGGIVIELIAAFVRSHGRFAPAATEIGIGLVVSVPIMLLGMFIAAKIRGIQLGSIGIAAFKLCALSIAPGAVGELAGIALNHIPFGGLLVLIGEFVLYFALLGALFDLDQSDTWYCICVIFIIQVAVYFALAVIR